VQDNESVALTVNTLKGISMYGLLTSFGIVTIMVLLSGSTLMADDNDRKLFSFENADSAKPWQAVNDGVMGGRSVGRFKINDGQKMEFFGTLSLKNNGGFASVRARGMKLGLEKGDVLVVRLRGDGREYNFNLYVPRSVRRLSYRQSFKTRKDDGSRCNCPWTSSLRTGEAESFQTRRLTRTM